LKEVLMQNLKQRAEALLMLRHAARRARQAADLHKLIACGPLCQSPGAHLQGAFDYDAASKLLHRRAQVLRVT
jgi:hypothetical protein